MKKEMEEGTIKTTTKRGHLMIKVIFGIFIILHGIVHLIYTGHSFRLFKVQAGLEWPDGSWALSYFLKNDSIRIIAGIFCIIAFIGFILGSIGVFSNSIWWRPVVIGTAAFSTIILILLWDGIMQKLPEKGVIAILINLAIIAVVLIIQRLNFKL